MVVIITCTLILLITNLTLAKQPEYKIANLTDDRQRQCPINVAMDNLDLDKFYGDWYVLEYQYPRELDFRDIGCVGMHYGSSHLDTELVLTNFTFRFPADSGFFYHIPTFSVLKPSSNAVWETHFRSAHISSMVVATDYSNWALLVQCNVLDDAEGASSFLSTRILARRRSLTPQTWLEIEARTEEANVHAQHKYLIRQGDCHDQ